MPIFRIVRLFTSLHRWAFLGLIGIAPVDLGASPDVQPEPLRLAPLSDRTVSACDSNGRGAKSWSEDDPELNVGVNSAGEQLAAVVKFALSGVTDDLFAARKIELHLFCSGRNGQFGALNICHLNSAGFGPVTGNDFMAASTPLNAVPVLKDVRPEQRLAIDVTDAVRNDVLAGRGYSAFRIAAVRPLTPPVKLVRFYGGAGKQSEKAERAPVLILFPARPLQTVNGLSNGEFTFHPGTWPWHSQVQGARVSCRIAAAGEPIPGASVAIDGAERPESGCWRQNLIHLPNGRPFDFSVAIKTDAVTSGLGAYAEIRFLDQARRLLGPPLRTPALIGDRNWTTLKLSGVIPPGTVSASVTLNLNATRGTAHFNRATLTYAARTAPEDDLIMSLNFPGKNVLFREDFSRYRVGTPAAELSGWRIAGKAVAQVSDFHPFTVTILDKLLEVKGGHPGCFTLPFGPLKSGRLRIAFGLGHVADRLPLEMKLYLKDSSGNRCFLMGWDGNSFSARPRYYPILVPGGHQSAPPLSINHSAAYPAFLKEKYQRWLYLIATELREDGQGTFVVNPNVEAAMAGYRKNLKRYPLSRLRDLAALELEVGPGEGSLFFSQLLIEGPLYRNRELDALIASRQAAMVPAVPSRSSALAPATESFRDTIIYQINPSVHTPSGKLADVASLIPHLKRLGVNLVYFTCLWESTRYVPGGDIGFPEGDGRKLSPNFGSPDDFRELVRLLHRHGFKVMVDFGFHSASWDSPLVRQHPEWFYKFPGGPFSGWPVGENFGYSYLFRYNLNFEDVQQHLIDQARFWVREFDIDAMRLDLAWSLFIDADTPNGTRQLFNFWRKFKSALIKEKPDFRLLGESSNRGMLNNGIDLEYSGLWHFRMRVLKDWLEKRKLPVGAVVHAITELLPREYPDEKLFMLALETHDMGEVAKTTGGGGKSYLLQGFGSRRKGDFYMGMLMTLPGVPLMFGGQEVNNRYFNAGYPEHAGRDEKTFAYYCRLFDLRRQFKFAEGGWQDVISLVPGGAADRPVYRPYDVKGNNRLVDAYLARSHFPDYLAYGRRTSSGDFVILGNHGEPARTIAVMAELYPAWKKRRVASVVHLNSGRVETVGRPLAGAWVLEPWEILILKLHP